MLHTEVLIRVIKSSDSFEKINHAILIPLKLSIMLNYDHSKIETSLMKNYLYSYYRKCRGILFYIEIYLIRHENPESTKIIHRWLWQLNLSSRKHLDIYFHISWHLTFQYTSSKFFRFPNSLNSFFWNNLTWNTKT